VVLIDFDRDGTPKQLNGDDEALALFRFNYDAFQATQWAVFNTNRLSGKKSAWVDRLTPHGMDSP
jgi:hypothetical protein